jgi:hypothetical protein
MSGEGPEERLRSKFGGSRVSPGAGRQAILQFVAIFALGTGILFIPNSELQIALKRLGEARRKGG